MEDAVASSSDEEEEQEEEGDTLDMHPDAVTVTLKVKKDPFYVKDPQKALKNLYERESECHFQVVFILVLFIHS